MYEYPIVYVQIYQLVHARWVEEILQQNAIRFFPTQIHGLCFECNIVLVDWYCFDGHGYTTKLDVLD